VLFRSVNGVGAFSGAWGVAAETGSGVSTTAGVPLGVPQLKEKRRETYKKGRSEIIRGRYAGASVRGSGR
jgi:hypothetical protein